MSKLNHSTTDGREVTANFFDRTGVQAVTLAAEHAHADIVRDALAGDALAGVMANSEIEYLEWLIEQARQAIGASHSFIGELSGSDWDSVKTVAVSVASGHAQLFEYDLAGTPCADVLTQTTCVFQEQVASMFPDDELLLEMKIDSYVGLPLHDVAGRPLGLAVVLDTKPMDFERARTALVLLVGVRARIQRALETRRVERDLHLLANTPSFDGAPSIEALVRRFAVSLATRGSFLTVLGDPSLSTVSKDGAVMPWEFNLDPKLETQLRDGTLRRPRVLDHKASLIANDGSAVTIGAFLLLPIFDHSGVPIAVAGAWHDKPLNPKIAEQSVVQAFSQRLEYALLTRQDQKARAARRRRMLELERTESLGILSAGIAHDFNNLLMGVLGNTDLLMHELNGEEFKAASELLADIRASSLSAHELCKQLLAYAGRATIEPTTFDLGAEVKNVSRLVAASFSASGRLAVTVDVTEAWVAGDAVQIRQVIMNLVKNAGDAIADQGSIQIDVGCSESTEVTPIEGLLEDLPAGSYAVLRVRDDGCGMSEQTRRKIFDPFFTTKASGHGLGLAGAIGVVRAHGGTIQVTSELGVGTTMQMLLPMVRRPAASATDEVAGAAAAAPTGKRFKILVADDERIVRKLLSRFIERLSYDVVLAEDGAEALEMYHLHRQDIVAVILDSNMPGRDGREILGEIRKIDPTLPAMLSSGQPGVQAGVAILAKPYGFDHFSAKLAEVLDTAVDGSEGSVEPA